MFNSDTIIKLARLPESIQIEFATRHPGLAANEHLVPEAWDLLWTAAGKDAAAAAELAGLPIAASRKDVIRVDRRNTVLDSYAHTHGFDADDLQFIATNRKPTKALCGWLLAQPNLPTELRVNGIFDTASPAAQLDWVMAATEEELDTGALSAFIASIPTRYADVPARGQGVRAKMTWKLRDAAVTWSVRRPDVLDALIETTGRTDFPEAAAKSPHLTGDAAERLFELFTADPVTWKWSLLALGGNPATPMATLDALESWARANRDSQGAVNLIENIAGRHAKSRTGIAFPLTDVTDETHLEWMVNQRSSYVDHYTGDHRRGSAWHLWYLAQIPALPEALGDRVASQLRFETQIPERDLDFVFDILDARYGWDSDDRVSPHPAGQQTTPPLVYTDEDAQNAIAAAPHRLSGRMLAAACDYVVDKLGEDSLAWDTLMLLLEERHDSLADVVDLALACTMD